MRTLLVLNDHSNQAVHAALFAVDLAQKIRANIILASIITPEMPTYQEDLQFNANGALVLQQSDLLKKMFAKKKSYNNFRPVIQEIEFSNFTEPELFKLTIDKNVYLVIKGMDEFLPSALLNINETINMLLGKIKCPLLVVPLSWQASKFRNIVYLTDIRFCGLKIVDVMADLAKEWNANLTIAHTTVSGLPELDGNEAGAIFKDEVSNHVHYKNLRMNMLKKGEIPDAIKLMVNHFNADLLIFVNQHFHFNTFTKQYFKDKCALYKPVPLLIFPY